MSNSVPSGVEKYIISRDNPRRNKYEATITHILHTVEKSFRIRHENYGRCVRCLETPDALCLTYKHKYVAFYVKDTHSFYDISRRQGLYKPYISKSISEFRNSFFDIKYWFLIL